MASFLSASRKQGLRALNRVPFQVQSRGFASEQQLKARINSVKTCQKITSAMKMVAAAKLKSAQDRLDKARVFSLDVPALVPEAEGAESAENMLVVAITGDKGLCGGVNSTLIRAVRDQLKEGKFGKDYQVVALGEKVRKGLERLFGKTMTVGVSENGRLKPPSFRQVSLIADHVTSHEYKKSVFIYQYFRSMVAYDTTSKLSVSYDEMVTDHKDKFYGYKIAGTPDTLKNMQEFSVALNLQLFFAETETSTLSSRMSAMDNSSNNAGDMLNALNLLLNRNRQARITTELTEIISGAAAVEDA